jgi:hypothetical protein
VIHRIPRIAIAVAASFVLSSTAVFAAKEAAAPAVIPAPPAGMSQVVFFRPNAQGMVISCNVREKGKMVGTINNGRYFVLTTTPGLHIFTTKSENTDTLNIETEADETSYVHCRIGEGLLLPRSNLSPTTKEKFDQLSAKLKLADPEKMAKTIAQDDAKRAANAK